MGDSDIKTWGLVILLALGGMWQISKTVTGSSLNKARAMDAAAVDRDDQPYSVETTGHPAAPGLIKHALPVADASVADAQLSKFLATAATATETKDTAPAKKEDKCVPKTDAATGKVIPCDVKKKKKKKKATTKTEETAAKVPKVNKPTAVDPKGIEWNVGAAIQTGRVNAVNTKADQPFESLEAWEARLLGTPDAAETKVFIDHYQRNLVSSDVFYKITQEMLDDSRSDMKLLGVMCAGVTSSVTSFQILAQFIAKQPTGTAPRTQADAALARYTDLSSLSILASVMRGNSIESATILAAQKLDVSARRYLVTTAPTTPAPGTTTPPSTTPSATPATTTAAATVKNRASFTRFVSILTSLSHVSDPQVKDQATRSLATLNGLLGTEATPPATTAGTTPTTPSAI